MLCSCHRLYLCHPQQRRSRWGCVPRPTQESRCPRRGRGSRSGAQAVLCSAAAAPAGPGTAPRNTRCGKRCMGIQHLLRGAGRVHKTAAGVFDGNELDPIGAQCVSFALAQKGSTNRHYLLLGTSHPPPGARLCVQLPFSCPQGFLLFSLLPCPVSHGSCRRKPGASNECQRAEHAREGSCELILQRSTEETEQRPPPAALLPAPELLNSSPASRSQRQHHTAGRAQTLSREGTAPKRD